MSGYLRAWLCALVVLLGILPAKAYDFRVDGIYYAFNGGGLTVVSGDTDYSGDVVIPSTVSYDGKVYSVTSIGGKVFSSCSGLTSVEIPNSVTTIGESAFRTCYSLTSVVIGESVRYIGPSAFEGCSGLTLVVIPNSVKSIGNYAFSSCRGLTSVVIPNSVTSIGDDAFSSCRGLTSVVIPNSVTSIGNYAFSDCSGLTSVVIPNSVTSIGDDAFYRCSSLEEIIVSTDNPAYSSLDGVLYNKDKTQLLKCPEEKSSVTIPNSVTIIGDNAFYGCSSLEEIIASTDNPAYSSLDGVLYNKDKTQLLKCPSKKSSVMIPGSVTTIGNYAFSSCHGLTSIEIPNSVTTIGESAFRACYNLTLVVIGESVTTIGESAFGACYSLTSVVIGESVRYIGSSAFSACYNLNLVVIPNSVKSIGYYAFSSCEGLTSVVIPNSVTSIVDGAFSYCSGLTSVTIPASVINIGASAFEGCSNLEEFIVSEENCFYCSLEGVLYDKDKSELLKCPSKKLEVTIPESVTSIRSTAFSDCSSLRKVTVYAITPPPIDSDTFNDYDIPLYVPVGSKQAYQEASYWNSFTSVQEVEVPKYEVEVRSEDEAKGSVTGGGQYNEGKLVTLSVIAAGGYEFVCWSDGNTENPRWLTVTGDLSLTAEFSPVYTLTVSSEDEAKGRVTGGGEYVEGTEITLYAIPSEGYELEQWSDGNSENPRRLTVTEDLSLTAEFSTLSKLTVSSEDETKGIVIAELAAIPNPGYRLLQWSDGSTENPRTIFVTENVNLVAEFVSSSAVETLTDQGMHAYVVDRTLHVENVEGDYRVYTTTGQLVYSGHAATVQLADAGVYVVRTSSRSQKVVVK